MVKNVNGTSKGNYVIPDLKQKFMALGGSSSCGCQHKGCSHKATATAHVIHVDKRKSSEWLLTSLCAKHNHHTNNKPIALRKNAALVPVKKVSAYKKK